MKFATAMAVLLPMPVVGLLLAGGGGGTVAAQERALLTEAAPLREGCGPAPSYPHAQPKEYQDARETFYNATSKQTEEVTFAIGENITFKCSPGHTADGSKDGDATFEVECSELGYYKPHGVCLKASKCGPIPSISHAAPTGEEKAGNNVEFACSQGYSLDGEKVVNGGLGKNRFFELECIEFSGEYQPFEGNCTAYAFVPAGETIRIYNQVTEALFVVSCKGSLKKAFGKGETPGLSSVCSSFADSGPACTALVAGIKGDFTRELAAREAHDSTAKKDWFEEKDADRPGIDDEAMTFCVELWKLLEMPSF